MCMIRSLHVAKVHWYWCFCVEEGLHQDVEEGLDQVEEEDLHQDVMVEQEKEEQHQGEEEDLLLVVVVVHPLVVAVGLLHQGQA